MTNLNLIAENLKLKKELEQVKAERDAAVNDFETYVNGDYETCAFCVYDIGCEPGETKCDYESSFEWRGKGD